MLNVANDSGKFWYQADALGSVYGLTNQGGALVGSQGYDVFGAPTPAPSGPAGQPFGFTGREHELDSGLVYARHRFLQPATGTWTRPDPYSLDGLSSRAVAPVPGVVPFDVAGRSGYEYPLPTLRADPQGLWVFGLGVGAGFILVTAGIELVAYVVVDGHNGLGILVVPSAHFGLAVGGDASIYAFFNPMADTIDDVAGWGASLNLALFAFSVGPTTSISVPDSNMRCERPPDPPSDFNLLWGVAGSVGLGLTFGIYVSAGYGFLWRLR